MRGPYRLYYKYVYSKLLVLILEISTLIDASK